MPEKIRTGADRARMARTEAERMRAQLAFAGWLPAEDPAEVTSDDEYTPLELVELVEDFFGGSIDLDVAWDPRCFVRPRVGYTKAEDGLDPKNSWLFDTSGKRFWNRWVQPPYSSPRRWLQRLVELHAEPDIEVGDSLALIKCDPSTRAWLHAWQSDAILFFAKRIPHVQPGRTTRNVSKFPQSLLYFGPHVAGFEAFFSSLGVVRRRPSPELEDVPVAREHELVKINGIPAYTYPFLPARKSKGIPGAGGRAEEIVELLHPTEPPVACEKHNAPDCQICADAITVVDEPVIDMSPIAESPQSWPVVDPLVCLGCGAKFRTPEGRAKHSCLAGGAR